MSSLPPAPCLCAPCTPCIRSCGQMLAPPHSLHVLLRRWCGQRLAPRTFCNSLLRCWCGQMLGPSSGAGAGRISPHRTPCMCPIRAGADMPFLVSSLFFLSSCPRCRSGAALSDDDDLGKFVDFAVMALAPLEDARKHVHGTTWTPGVPLTAADVLKVAFLPCPSSPARRLRPRQTVCLAKMLSTRGSLPLFVLPLAFYASWHRKRGGDKA